MKSNIVPAILKPSFQEISAAVWSVSDIAPYVQIDIVDNSYTQSATWPFNSGGVSREELALLDTLTASYELDLMIRNPEETLDLWLETAAKRCIIHVSSTNSLLSCIRRIKEGGKEAYIGLVIDDDLNNISEAIEEADGVQCMGIRHVGKQGEPYDAGVINLIRTIQSMRPLPISVDGAVSIDTIPALKEAGVEQFAVGSALFRGDIAQNFTRLNECATG